MIDQQHLPIVLPEVEKYLPTEEGEPPLGRADVWAWCTETNTIVSNDKINGTTVFPLELNTMPGWAGSSWYFFRYMEEAANRDAAFATEDALNYWENVDLYIGGSEHATGHLLYARFWVKFLKDRGFIGVDEPFKKLINQGMILGTSAIVNGYWVSFSNHNSEQDLNSEDDKIAEAVNRPFLLVVSKEIFDEADPEKIEDWIVDKFPNSTPPCMFDKNMSIKKSFQLYPNVNPYRCLICKLI